jgi:hypothetical protein
MKKLLLLSIFAFAIHQLGFSAPPPAGAIYPFFDDFESYNPNAGTLGSPKWYGGASSFRSYGNHGLFETQGMSFESAAFIPKDSITSSEIGPFTLQSKLYFHYRLVESAGWPTVPYAMASDAIFRIKMLSQLNPDPVVFSLDSLTQGTPTTNFTYVEIPLDTYVGQSAFFEIYFDMGAQIGMHWLDIDDFGVSDVVVTGSGQGPVTEKWNYFYNGSELRVNDQEVSQYRLMSMSGALISEWNHQPGTEVKSLSDIAKGLYVLTRNSGGSIESKKVVVN